MNKFSSKHYASKEDGDPEISQILKFHALLFLAFLREIIQYKNK